jgi:hypothetical protein
MMTRSGCIEVLGHGERRVEGLADDGFAREDAQGEADAVVGIRELCCSVVEVDLAARVRWNSVR